MTDNAYIPEEKFQEEQYAGYARSQVVMNLTFKSVHQQTRLRQILQMEEAERAYHKLNFASTNEAIAAHAYSLGRLELLRDLVTLGNVVSD